MEELQEVITAAEFHPIQCNLFMYSSSKGTIKLSDMRQRALCDNHAKGEEGERGEVTKRERKPENFLTFYLFFLSSIFFSLF